jgi:hypothetical protein
LAVARRSGGGGVDAVVIGTPRAQSHRTSNDADTFASQSSKPDSADTSRCCSVAHRATSAAVSTAHLAQPAPGSHPVGPAGCRNVEDATTGRQPQASRTAFAYLRAIVTAAAAIASLAALPPIHPPGRLPAYPALHGPNSAVPLGTRRHR